MATRRPATPLGPLLQAARTLALAAAAWSANPACAAQAPAPQSGRTVVTPQAQFEADHYFISMLGLALSHAPGNYALKQWRMPLERGRAVRELASGERLDVIWAVTSRERERLLLPVRIPIDKGLFGWRIALIKARDSASFAAIGSLDELRRRKAGLGFDWEETAVLRANRLHVVTGNNSNGLYSMLAAGRFDYFPRAMGQVWNEGQRQAERGLVVEPGFALHFPTAVYFFVNQRDTVLAAALEQGLRAAIADGSFDKLFLEHNAESIRHARLGQRRIFELSNPDLPPATPLADKRLWYAPER